MERKVTEAILVLLVSLMVAVLGIEGGRKLPRKDGIYSPQHLLGLGGPFGLGWPFPLPFTFFKPWLGGCCSLLPCLGAYKA
ncbi:hypothetical protein SLEP1_g42377 [Rubroshorea leprosula]|uniref:Uncharacterized protein n=1 Tax=Rubroshorea leprosula TaxID=152421 RepID=A0AAV5LAI7_9ROSI|nr:hypothetical protein SLEP1_g42377 [Rubroshorea leprosula]